MCATSPPLKPSPPGRALLQTTHSRLLTGVCDFSTSQAFSSWTRALLRLLTLGYSQVCATSPPLKPSPPGRALLRLLTLGYSQVCATSPPTQAFSSWTRALLRLLTRLLTGVCDFSTSQAFSSWTRALLRLLTLATHRCVRLLHLSSLLLLDARAPQTTHSATHRCVRLLHLSSLLLLDARAPQTTHSATHRCVRLLHLSSLLLLDTRAPQTTHSATHRCVRLLHLLKPSSPGRALLRLTRLITGVCNFSTSSSLLLLDARLLQTTHSRLLTGVCDFSTSQAILLSGRARSFRLLTLGYSQVCATSPPLKPSPPLDARLLQTTHSRLLTGVCDFSTSQAFSSSGHAPPSDYSLSATHRCVRLLHLSSHSPLWMRALLQTTHSRLLTGVCDFSTSQAFSSWTRAPQTTHSRTGVCDFSTSQAFSSWTRAPQTTHSRLLTGVLLTVWEPERTRICP